jgi:hypothetical protein
MRVANIEQLMANPNVLKEMAADVAAGKSVRLVPMSGDDTHPVKEPSYSPEMQRAIEAYAMAGLASLSAVKVHAAAGKEWKAASKDWSAPGLVIGGVTGTVMGAAIGELLDQLGAVHPKSAMVFKMVCAVIGASGGAAVGSKTLRIKGPGGWEIQPGQ